MIVMTPKRASGFMKIKLQSDNKYFVGVFNVSIKAQTRDKNF